MFTIDVTLLQQAQKIFRQHPPIYWVVGGAGSGKTTICRALADTYGLTLYDMDAHIYGEYHGRFTPQRHPVNSQWAAATNPFTWLLEMSWAQFESFNQAAVPEYLDLLAEDLASMPPDTPILIDGGIVHTAVAAQAFPARQMVCLVRPALSSAEIWSETEERLGMKAMIDQLPNPAQTWQKFLAFDEQITQTLVQESQAATIAICTRAETDSVTALAQRVADRLVLAKIGGATAVSSPG